jgi:serine protease Do
MVWMKHIAPRRQRRVSGLSAALLAGTALALAAPLAHADQKPNPPAEHSSPTPGTATKLPGKLAVGANQALNETAAVQKNFKPLPSFAPLVKLVRPAVVSVTVHMKIQKASDQGPPGFNPHQGMPFPFPFPFGQMQPQRPQVVEAKGSGFIISPKGYIVTNNHVVHNAKSVFVTMSDGERLPATIVGTDKGTDLAVIRIKAKHPLPYLEFGNSSKVTPGQWVIAVGNPFGLASTVTTGVVSALGRDIGDGEYDRFIQIDAPINEGNSGGPLFNQKGQVIGVNTAILSPTGGSVGIGFSIPSDTVKYITTELIKQGHVTRGFLGVTVQSITPEMAQAMGVTMHNGKAEGALIAAVAPNSPALHAGIKPGDIITKVNGQPVKSSRDLALDISETKPGKDAKLDYVRDGKTKTTTVAVATMPANAQAAFGNGEQQKAAPSHAELGLSLAPLSQSDRQQFNLPGGTEGAVIAHVTPNSAADTAGLRPGDVIVGVGSTAVGNPDQAVKAIQAAEKNHAKAVALRVMRGDQSVFVAVALPHGKKEQKNG